MKNTKLCFVIPSLVKGGMERVMCILANFASESGYEVHIVCLAKSTIEYELNPAVNVHFPTQPYKKNIFAKWSLLLYLMSKLRTVKPLSVLSFGEGFNSFAILAAKLCGLNIFISDRSSPLAKTPFPHDLLRQLIYPFANGLIAQTQVARSHFLKKKYNKNIVAIPNPLKELVNDQNSSELKKAIVTVGRLIPSKNHEELIRVFHKINNPAWKLIIVGNGPLYNDLTLLIEKLQLRDRVIITGVAEDVDVWLRRADIFAYTSLLEGFPNALSEAVAFPLPAISYDCVAGPSEIITNNVSGLLIPVGNFEEYVNGLELLMTDSALRDRFSVMGRNNRDLFSVETVGSKYLAFISGGENIE